MFSAVFSVSIARITSPTMVTVVELASILMLLLTPISCAEVFKQGEKFIREGDFGVQYEFHVNKGTEFTHLYKNVAQLLLNRTARVVVESVNADDNNPVLMVVRQKKDVMAWQHPLIVSSRSGVNNEYQKVSRTICPSKYYMSNTSESTEDEDEVISVTASTSSLETVAVKLSVEFVDDFYLNLSENKNVTVTPSEPSFYGYIFSNDTDTLFLALNSADDACTTISVQDINCPIYDLEKNVKFEGQWETMIHKGGLTLKRERYPNGFYLVFVVNGDDEECTMVSNRTNEDRITTLSFKLIPGLSKDKYINVIVGTLMIILILFYLPCGVVICCTYKKASDSRLKQKIAALVGGNDRKTSEEQDDEILSWTNAAINLFHRASKKKSQVYLWITILAGIFYFVPTVQRVITHLLILQETGNEDLCYYNRHCAHPLGHLLDFNHVFSNIGYILLGFLFIMITRSHQYLYENQPLYTHHQKNQEKYLHRKFIKPEEETTQAYTLPQQFGIFYSMGIALMAEGLLSGTYHICPRGSNFQFDTTFMYVTAMLCMVKIYKNRLQDAYANARAVYMFLGLVTFIVMLGNVIPSLYLLYAIGGCQILICLVMSAQIYYMERISIGWNGITTACDLWKDGCLSCNCKTPRSGIKILLLLLVNILNWVVAILGMLRILGDVATYMLDIFILNLTFFFGYYIFLKYHHILSKKSSQLPSNTDNKKRDNREKELQEMRRLQSEEVEFSNKVVDDTGEAGNRKTSSAESHSKQSFAELCRENICPNIFLLFTAILWPTALYFFFQRVTSWEDTPALSRDKNKSCIIQDFYDSHDLWHFLSAGGMFFSFMALLTLNDHHIASP